MGQMECRDGIGKDEEGRVLVIKAAVGALRRPTDGEELPLLTADSTEG